MNNKYKIAILITLMFQGCTPHHTIDDSDMMEVKDAYQEAIDSTPNAIIPAPITPKTPITTITVKQAETPKYVAKTISGNIFGSFYSSFSRNGGTNNIGKIVVSSMKDKIDFSSDINNGDSFTVISVGNKVIYIEFNLKKLGRITAFGKIIGQSEAMFNPDGTSTRKPFLKYPVKYTRISSSFSKYRWHPILKRYTAHNGIDLVSRYGTPVHSVGDGYVEAAKSSNRGGKYVKINHGGHIETIYAHLSKIRCHVRQKIEKGQIIGNVGNSGMSTGTHLHFEYRVSGIPIDPVKMINKPETEISLAEIDKLQKIVSQIMSRKTIN